MNSSTCTNSMHFSRRRNYRISRLFQWVFFTIPLMGLQCQAGVISFKTFPGFFSPQPGCPPATCAGLGTPFFSFGSGSSLLTFPGREFSADVPPSGLSDPFYIGTLGFSNGTSITGTSVDAVELLITGVGIGTDVTFSSDRDIFIANTPNTDDPFESADFLSISGLASIGIFGVLEGGYGSTDLYARASRPLAASADIINVDIVGWGNPQGDGFIKLQDGTIMLPTPEPSTWTPVCFLAVIIFIRSTLNRPTRPKRVEATARRGQ